MEKEYIRGRARKEIVVKKRFFLIPFSILSIFLYPDFYS